MIWIILLFSGQTIVECKFQVNNESTILVSINYNK